MRKRRIRRGRIHHVPVARSRRRGRINREPVRLTRRRPRQIGCRRHGYHSIRTLHACRRVGGADVERQRRRRTLLLRHSERLRANRHRASPRLVARILRNGDAHQIAALSVARIHNRNPAVVRRDAPLRDGEGIDRDWDHVRLVVLRYGSRFQFHPPPVLEHRECIPCNRQRPLPCRHFVIRRNLISDRS